MVISGTKLFMTKFRLVSTAVIFKHDSLFFIKFHQKITQPVCSKKIAFSTITQSGQYWFVSPYICSFFLYLHQLMLINLKLEIKEYVRIIFQGYMLCTASWFFIAELKWSWHSCIRERSWTTLMSLWLCWILFSGTEFPFVYFWQCMVTVVSTRIFVTDYYLEVIYSAGWVVTDTYPDVIKKMYFLLLSPRTVSKNSALFMENSYDETMILCIMPCFTDSIELFRNSFIEFDEFIELVS